MPLSAKATAALFAQETAEVFLVLLTVEHQDLAEPIRVVNNTEDITSRGHLFVGWPFEVTLPDSDPQQVSRATLRIDNVDRQITAAIRGLTSSPTLTFEVIMASTPDVVEVSFGNMQLESVQYDALEISGELTYENVLIEPYPGDSFTPQNFPGLF